MEKRGKKEFQKLFIYEEPFGYLFGVNYLLNKERMKTIFFFFIFFLVAYAIYLENDATDLPHSLLSFGVIPGNNTCPEYPLSPFYQFLKINQTPAFVSDKNNRLCTRNIKDARNNTNGWSKIYYFTPNQFIILSDWRYCLPVDRCFTYLKWNVK